MKVVFIIVAMSSTNNQPIDNNSYQHSEILMATNDSYLSYLQTKDEELIEDRIK